MTTERDEPAGDGATGTAQTFAALPDRTDDDTSTFHRCLAEVSRIPGLKPAPEPADGDGRAWGHAVRRALRDAGERGLVLSEESFEALLEAAVQDPDPSYNRWFVEPALNAYGYRRVRAGLLARLVGGTDAQRAGAARAWYWTAFPLDSDGATAEHPGALELDGATDRAVLVREWNEAALREFVTNEDLDVRRCILPGLPLRTSAYRPELHHLVETATAVARAHPDDYIRHRVENQVRI
ncbi:hypothetical protein OG618_00540 [Kitasatospora sp. NBC_01246]|uniref:hypothetical protein n=1 Tax=Kitasatospora sp. NBC_01246 TaxID=2903570 RepID=UPI002E2FCD40|nr:hypothetical protein [Kitasatospora sp. NBC_01246]